MNVNVEVQTGEAWRRVLTIEVPAEEAAREYEKIVAKVAKQFKMAGFRKGKVPVAIVKRTLKSELDSEFLETVVPRALSAALEQTGLDPVTEPSFEDLSFGEERPLSFSAAFECRPDLEITGYKGLAVTKEVPEVEEEHVDGILEDFRKSHAELEDVEREAIDGDVLLLDYQAEDEAGKPIAGRSVKDYQLELGTRQVVEPFEQAVAKATPGTVCEAEVPYPDDYPDEVLAGTNARYKIKVRKVQEKRYPSLDDELVAAKTEQKTVDELRARIREDLGKQADQAGTDRLAHALVGKVVDANPFEPPVTLVDDLLEDTVRRMKGEAERRGEDTASFDEEEIKKTHRERAEREVRRFLIMDRIGEQEKIEVTSEEVRTHIARLAAMQGQGPKQFLEAFGGDRLIRRVSRDLRDKKVLAFLVENAEITEKTVKVEPEAKS